MADPKILILDEATANIDSHTEAQIQLALRSLLRGRTAIVIAHRLSTIRGADKIVVLNHGELVEEGTHNELLDRDGLYSHLYHMNYAVLEEIGVDVASPQRANPIRSHLASFPIGGKTKEAGYPRIQEGSMTGNLRATRHLDLEGAYNIRDIGGYETIDGRRTRPRTLFRSDSLHNLTPDSQSALVSEGLRTVVDLRVTESVSEHPNVFARSSEVDYRCVNVMGDEPLVEVSDIRVSALGPDRPPDIYAAIIDRRREWMGKVVKLLATPGALPALYHCNSGRDRAGLVTMLLLSIARTCRRKPSWRTTAHRQRICGGASPTARPSRRLTSRPGRF